MPVTGTLFLEAFATAPAGWETSTRYTGGATTGYPNIYKACAVQIVEDAGPAGENVLLPDTSDPTYVFMGGVYYRFTDAAQFPASQCRLTFDLKLDHALVEYLVDRELNGFSNGSLVYFGDTFGGGSGNIAIVCGYGGLVGSTRTTLWTVFYYTAAGGVIDSPTVHNTNVGLEEDVWYEITFAWTCGTILTPGDGTNPPVVAEDGCFRLSAKAVGSDRVEIVHEADIALLIDFVSPGGLVTAANTIGDLAFGYEPADISSATVWTLPGPLANIRIASTDDILCPPIPPPTNPFCECVAPPTSPPRLPPPITHPPPLTPIIGAQLSCDGGGLVPTQEDVLPSETWWGM